MEKIFLCMAFLCIFANNDIIKIDDKFIKGKFYMKECDNINTNKKILLNKEFRLALGDWVYNVRSKQVYYKL